MKLICVSGSSGVGKTTLTRLIESVLSHEGVVCLSGDDLHLWERSDPIWNKLTHLDPQGNDLETGYQHIVNLKSGKSISRRFYNHDTGKFDPPKELYPKTYLVYEGLHALYHQPTLDLADICIFVDTDEALKTEWKVKRDTKKRGYTESQVMDTMRRRKRDEDQYITPQRDRADIITKFTKGKDASISLEYVCVTGKGEWLMKRVKGFYDSLTDFLEITKALSLDPSLTQGRGGNVSVKSNSGLIIKASGANMADINLYHGFCVCRIDGNSLPYFNDEEEYNEFIRKSKTVGNQRPSMETGFHAAISDSVVVHTHPIHLNVILCSKEARAVVRGLFKDMSYEFVEYTTPGSELTNRLHNLSGVIFLENHGLIVSAKTADDAMRMTEDINNRCKRWLGNHVESFVDVDESGTNQSPLFPDAAVLPQEMSETNNYIMRLMIGACLTPKFLDDKEVGHLNNMASEKYRKALS